MVTVRYSCVSGSFLRHLIDQKQCLWGRRCVQSCTAAMECSQIIALIAMIAIYFTGVLRAME